MTAKTIDIHAHILSEDTVRLLQRETPQVAPRLTPIDAEFSVLEISGKPYKPFPRGASDIERRLGDMDKFGFDMQAVTVCPQTFLYDREPSLTLAVCQVQNDQIAALCRRYPDRFLGLGSVPLQAPELAAQELRRAMTKGALKGLQIGANVQGRNLDDPALDPFWAAADELEAFILVHPMNAAGVPGVESYYLKNLIGNPLDTTVAVACLVFGGVIERHPGIRFCMAHGGGFAPYQAGRFVHGWTVRDEPKVRLKQSPKASLDRLLYDTILHARGPLEFLIESVGASRVMLGSDYPFDMGQYDSIALIGSLSIPEADKAAVLGGSARALLGGADAMGGSEAAQ